MNDLEKILMARDGLTEIEARAQVAKARAELMERLEEAKREYDPGAGEIIIEIDPGTGRKLWEVIP